MANKIEISYKTIVFTILLLMFLWFLIQIKTIIFLLFVSFIIMSALKPPVDYLENKHLPRILSILLFFMLTVAVFIFAVSMILPILITQSIHLGNQLPEYIKTIIPSVKFDNQIITQHLTSMGQNVIDVTIKLFSNMISLFTVIVISFYFLLERKRLEKQLSGFMGDDGSGKIMVIITLIEERLGAWVRGQLTLALTIGIATYTGLTLLGIPYPLALAIFAGIMEIVPIIGPIISAIPAVIIAVTSSLWLAAATIFLYFIIQQLEAQIVVPMVMRRAVGLPPVVTIIALMVGAKLAGVGGALLSIPTVVTAEIVVSAYMKLKESNLVSTEAHKPDSVFPD